jgi:hypothetical protein
MIIPDEMMNELDRDNCSAVIPATQPDIPPAKEPATRLCGDSK